MLKARIPLPVKNGVPPNKIWLPAGDWENIFKFFQSRFPQLSKADCESRFENNEICYANGEFLTKDSAYQSGQHLYFYHEVANELSVPFEESIIYQDDNIIVADKPHFLPVSPSGQYLHNTLLVRLRQKLANDQIELCHRLDRETAGIVLLTKRAEVRAAYQSLFAERKVVKTYHARAPKLNIDFPMTIKSRMVKGQPFMRMQSVAGDANSETIISLLSQEEQYNLYQLKPVTGKKHQLRVHMASLGAPIKNDILYPDFLPRQPGDFANPLQLLAKKLEFIDPLDGTCKTFESPQQL